MIEISQSRTKCWSVEVRIWKSVTVVI
jgi:hypothetical protein